MTDIDKLIRLNVELEGLLKVLADRNSIDARSLLSEKYREYTETFGKLLAQGEELAAEAHAVEVKDQEAVDSEVLDETDAATEAIERRSSTADPAEDTVSSHYETTDDAADRRLKTASPRDNTSVLDAFSTADRDRFRRELFNSDEDDMNVTVALIAHMPSYEEAADYLTNDLLWDDRNAAVVDFLTILKANMHS